MAGRGTDILLGAGVEELSGLHVIGTFRFDASRIDDQLRGRAGRQGQPGSSHFIISVQDKSFRRYLGGYSYILDQIYQFHNMSDQKFRRELASQAQKKAEKDHFELRERRNQIYAVQNDQVERFFSKIHDLFSTQKITALFPEILKSLPGTPPEFEDNSFLYNYCRSMVMEYWSHHLQYLDDLEEGFEDQTGDAFEEGLARFKVAAEENFQTVLTLLIKDATQFYGRLVKLDPETIQRRVNEYEKRQKAPFDSSSAAVARSL